MQEKIRRKIKWKQHVLGLLSLMIMISVLWSWNERHGKEIIREKVKAYQLSNLNKEQIEHYVHTQINNDKAIIESGYFNYKPLLYMIIAGTTLFSVYDKTEKELYKDELMDQLVSFSKEERKELLLQKMAKLGSEHKKLPLDHLKLEEEKFYNNMLKFLELLQDTTIDYASIAPDRLSNFKNNLETFSMNGKWDIDSVRQVFSSVYAIHDNLQKAASLLIQAHDLLIDAGFGKTKNIGFQHGMYTDLTQQNYSVNKAASLHFRIVPLPDLSLGDSYGIHNGDTVTFDSGYFTVPVSTSEVGVHQDSLTIYLFNPLTGHSEKIKHSFNYKVFPKQ